METIDLSTSAGLDEYLRMAGVTAATNGRNVPKSKRARRKRRNAPTPRPDGWVARVQHVAVDIRPFGKERPRYNGKQDGNRAYMRPEYQAKKEQLRLLFGEVLVTMPIIMDVVAVRKMPKSWSLKKQDALFGRVCMTTPDYDNIAGALADTLFADDSGVVSGVTTKLWGYADELHITLTEWDETAVWEW